MKALYAMHRPYAWRGDLEILETLDMDSQDRLEELDVLCSEYRTVTILDCKNFAHLKTIWRRLGTSRRRLGTA